MRFPGFVGGTYQMRSITTECQRCINLYPDMDESTAGSVSTARNNEVGVLLGTPGTELLITLPQSPVRGVWAVRNYNRVFAVAGSGFYELLNNNGAYSSVLLGNLLTTYSFIVVNANATLGATYTNNGVTFTVIETISSGAILQATASSPPAASGILNLTSGTGDQNINFSGWTITSTGPVGMSDNGIEVCIVDGANGYSYDLLEQSILPQAYVFTLAAPANATLGATYTNNAQTFTVLDTISAGTVLFMTGTGAPLSADTLTLASGTGDATIAYNSYAIESQQPWIANTAYTAGQQIIPTIGGYIYTATNSGTSGALQPLFPTARGATILDGSIIWERASSFMVITDPGFLGSNVVAYQDGYFFFAKPGTNQVYCSNLFATSFNALNFDNLEGSTAPILNMVSIHRYLYIQTTETTEVYYDAGVSPGFPFSRINGAYLDQGLVAQFALAQSANAIFWLGQDKSGGGIVYTTSTFTPQRISTFAVEEQLEEYETISDAIGYTYTEGGHSFYVLNFPTAQKTWCYDISTGYWHERAYNSNGQLIMQQYAYHQFGFGIHIVGDYTSGNIYQMSQDFYTDNGTSIIRKRVAPHLSNDDLRVFYHSLQIDFQSGVALDGSVQGSNPICLLRFSDDGARTWSNIKAVSFGKIGQYKKRALFRRLGHARDRVFEVTITDPVFVAITGASLMLEPGSS